MSFYQSAQANSYVPCGMQKKSHLRVYCEKLRHSESENRLGEGSFLSQNLRLLLILFQLCYLRGSLYRDADKSLARMGRKQARKHFRDARYFNNVETRAVTKYFFPPARQGAEGNSCHSDRNISLFPSWTG